MTRVLLDQFQLPNAGYIACTVTLYVADATGAATATKATLYDGLTSSGTLLNPQSFTSEGALFQPTYIDVPVVPVISGGHATSQTLGVVCPPGGARGDYVAAGTLYLPGDIVTDGAAGANTHDIYAVVNLFASTTWAADHVNAAKMKSVLAASSVAVPDATESTKGKAQIATQAQMNAGTNDLAFTTALKVVTYITNLLAAAVSVTGLWSFKNTKSVVQTLTDAATIAWNVANGNAALVILTASGHTFGAPTGIQAGAFYFLGAKQDATGSRTANWNAAFNFGAVGTPTLTTAAGQTDYFTFFCPDGTNLHCVGKALGF